jgi:redox-sensitive bicupin YhaK (pirin superfamily)
VIEVSEDLVVAIKPLGFPWETTDPFLFCVYHDDKFPPGNAEMGPAASLAGRNLGNDFAGKDGWRMYHGAIVPGFPAHPHRGFETVTIVRQGFIDHSDSLGAAARFGHGDVQWLTAGRGTVHSEMFPILNENGPNPLELFQIWLNLPRLGKRADPYFAIFWNEKLARHVARDPGGRATEIVMVAGGIGETRAPMPPPDSWAAHEESDLAIWTIKMAPEARWTIPPAAPGTRRTLYFFKGADLKVGGRSVSPKHAVQLHGDVEAPLESGCEPAELLLLQGRPIGEPVVHYGPFVMNSRAEIEQAVADYQRTQFGGWPWPTDAPVHARQEGRFARFPDGHVERPG